MQKSRTHINFMATCITLCENALLIMPALALPTATTVVVPKVKFV